jgi:hypothetical protein
MPTDGDFYIDRASLSTVFKDPRTLTAFETALQVVQATPEGIDQAQQAADQAALDAAAAAAAASGAQGGVLALNAAPFVTFAASATLSAERILTGSAGVTLDVATAGLIRILVNALAILNVAPVVLTQALSAPSADIQGALQCDSLRIDAAPAASVTAASHALAISLNGTTYYLKLSATP